MTLDFFNEWSIPSILVRILIAAVLGSIVGIDRGVTRRGGAKTNMIVCLGATLVTLTDQYVQHMYPGTADLTRMSAQVISGVGFLGAGTIMVSGTRVKGLSAAASIWTCACIGIATGLGFVFGAVIMTAVLLIGLHILPVIENSYYKHTNYLSLYIEVENGKAITDMLKKVRNDGCDIDTYEVEKPKAKGQFYTIMIILHTPKGFDSEDYIDELCDMKGIMTVEEM